MKTVTEEQAQPDGRSTASKPPIQWALWAVLVAALGLAFAPVIAEWVMDWIRDSNYNHGFLIPIISGYLIWKSRSELARAESAPSAWGLVGLFASAALLVLGTAAVEVFMQRVSFVLFLSSLVFFLWGRRHFQLTAFPFAVLLLAIPLPYVVYYGLTGPMQAFAAKCAVFGLKLIGVPVAAQGNIIHLTDCSIEVAGACSGIRSLYAFLTLGALMAYSTAVPLWGKWLIFLSTVPLSIAGNAVRVLGTGLGVYLIGPQVAKGTVHELFGLLVIGVCFLLFVLLKKVVQGLWSPASS